MNEKEDQIFDVPLSRNGRGKKLPKNLIKYPQGKRNPNPKKRGPKKVIAIPPTDPNDPSTKWYGRVPAREINMDQVLYWMDLQATAEEIAGAFRVSVDTLEDRLVEVFGAKFAEVKKLCTGESKLSLRRYQYNQAKTNTSMAIWLGKVWLNQKDTTEHAPPVQIMITKQG